MATFSEKENVDIPQHQVFVNFRGVELRKNFVSHLENRLTKNGINVFVDSNEDAGQDMNVLIQRIEESRIALAIFSPRYTESKWCLKELAKMKERKDEGKLVIIPVFYKVKVETVKKQMGSFGDNFRELVVHIEDSTKKEWTDALKSVAHIIGLVLTDQSDESEEIDKIFGEVKKALNKVSHDSLSTSNNVGLPSSLTTKTEKIPESLWGIKLRLKQLEKKLSLNSEKTCIIGVVGMPGIGKTTLVTKLYEKTNGRFLSHSQILDIHEVSNEDGLHYLPIILIQDLLKINNPNIESVEAAHKPYKDQLLMTKVLVVLDNVSNKEEIDVLLGDRDWIKQGSKIVIATNDKALLKGLVDDIYEVPRLCDEDGLQHFNHYAFNHTQQQQQKQQFSLLSKRFVHYAKGNPLALKILGAELKGKDKAHWESKLAALTQHYNGPLGKISSSKMLQRIWEGSYHGLNQEQKDMLLDIACFKSMNESYLMSLLDFDDAKKGISDLVNRFMISVTSSGQVEMHETLYVLSKQFGRDDKGQCRLWQHQSIIDMLENNKGASGVRSILLDLSEIKMVKSFHSRAFFWMKNMRYLKIYSTKCPQECERDIILHFPNELNFPLNELRCLQWLKFPLKELPPDFEPKNLVDLKLTYSKIERVWEGDKDAPKLKWINLNHSRKLSTLSGLANARNVQELNLEGCISLRMLPVDMQNMELLVFLNLKGCTSLESLPDINLISLETLILTECSKLKEFQVISEKLETLYLNGTSIKKLPDEINKLQTLILLNLKDCKKLKTLPDSFDKLTALQELILSGCSKLKKLPNIGENMKFLEILLLNDTSIEEIPFIKSLRRLSLSGNENIINLPDFITRLTKLEWLDLKYCKNLTYVPKLPPNLQWLDASCCFSLTTIAKQLISTIGIDLSMEKMNSMFIFANCNDLEEVAKKQIVMYAERKCKLLSNAVNCYNEVFVSEILLITCFPGYEIPSWFSYETIGSLMEFELLPHWNYTKISGISICVVISFKNHQNHAKLSVKFTCDESSTSMSWKMGGIITENCSKSDTVKSDHVFIGYINCLDFVKLVKDQQSRRSNCAATKASFEFSCASEKEDCFEVLKSGFSFMFESDENRNRYHREVNLSVSQEISVTKENEIVSPEVMQADPTTMVEWQNIFRKSCEKTDDFEIISDHVKMISPRGILPNMY